MKTTKNGSQALNDAIRVYSNVKDKLFVILRHEIPDDSIMYRKIWDMYETVSIELLGLGVSTPVTKAVFEAWEISEDELFDHAVATMAKSYPLKAFDVAGFVGEPGKGRWPLTAITNEESMYGASVILYPDFMEKAYEEAGEDFFVLPSSIHEVLIVPKSKAEPEDLARIVRDVNENVVAPDEVLSYNVFQMKMHLEIVNK
jgi:hypothetical protein